MQACPRSIQPQRTQVHQCTAVMHMLLLRISGASPRSPVSTPCHHISILAPFLCTFFAAQSTRQPSVSCYPPECLPLPLATSSLGTGMTRAFISTLTGFTDALPACRPLRITMISSPRWQFRTFMLRDALPGSQRL